uniref:phosphatidylinositol 4,5-bisphosphate 3-kinase catalytic subunit beta isoform-like n=1 Tax=Styela clava TaxID=7725 RepID=UPI00193A7D32|nr:phosphatidylinositol 4,5-bisphosphate 3-kinase catalytic subunit beta isoform-like [Styela clava]
MYHHNQHEEEETIYDEWGYHNSAYVMVDFLLPTGIYIPMEVERNSTIEKIKKQLWDRAIQFPLFGQLSGPDMYVFMYVTGIGTTEEIVTENRRLIEIDLLHELPMLKLVKRQGNIEEKRVAQEIKTLAGIKNESEINKDPEKAHFRTKMRKKALEVVNEREKMHWKDLLNHNYPPSIVYEQEPFLRQYGLVPVKYENVEGMVKKMKVNPNWMSHDLTREALSTWRNAGIALPTTNPEDYVLRAPGKEYIVGNYQLFQYKVLRDGLVKRPNVEETQPPDTPTLILYHVASIRPILPQSSYGFEQLKLAPLPPPMPSRRHNTMSLWKLDTSFNVQVVRTGNINTKMDKKFIVHIGLYHGISTLCNTCYTHNAKETRENDKLTLDWEDICYFDITSCHLPRNSRLCISICVIDKKDVKKGTNKKKGDKKNDQRSIYANSTPLFWVNMNIFDFQGVLKSGRHTLPCWSWPENLENDTLNPLGVVTTNPDEESVYIELDLSEYATPVAYPPFQDVLAEAAQQTDVATNPEIFTKASKTHLQQLDEMLGKPSQDELFENEKELLWYLRMECRDHYPQYLSKILGTIKWNSYKSVAQMQALLNCWTQLEPERALELLDCQYADEKIREFAVSCLRKLPDDQLQQYLLQLVQVIKYESYIDNPLVLFLLERAWKNRKVGHFLFWHLKSEMSDQYVGGRFSLILEAYLYGNIPHLHNLVRQHDALMKMKSLNQLVKSPGIKQSDVPSQGRQALHECINQESYAEALSQVECPLDPSILLEKPETEPCKVMNSKMRPLWLVFKNQDSLTGKISVIYKNGDDLRQDMLTLQIISIMDILWKSEGLDLRMIPYGCLSTGVKMGMIEVVTNSNTIANIQKKKAGRFTAAFRHETLFEWIQEYNKTPKELETAIQNFTYSCAGYCVATYVLGVGDRHSDNIMVTEKGQLFHIDFGHILGNFKSKYGIKRERVPFVLAHDFVHVINKGKTDTKEEFEKFRKLCDHAFLILRKKGFLFVTLFSLMLSSGLPELTSLEDLNYLRESLALHVSEEQARKQFRSKFNKALKDAWSTSLNWFFHNVAKDNR